MKTIYLLPALAILGIAPKAAAQTTIIEEPNVTIIVGDPNAARIVEEELTGNAPERPNDNGLPRFAIVGHEHKFYLGIGAQFLGEGLFDFGDQMSSPVDFVPSDISRPAPGDGGSLRFSALTSSFYVNAVALPGTKDKIGLFFKGEIKDGDSYGFSVSHFYVTYRGFKAGLTTGVFTDGAAMPYTIDDQGPNGSVHKKMFNLSYTYKFTPSLSGAIGIDAPSVDLSYNADTREVSQRLPAVPLYLQYAWGKKSHLRASAIIRPLQYRDLVADKNRSIAGWGVQASGIAELTPGFNFLFDATYGAGISDYLQDDADLGLDATPSYDDNGRLKAMKSLGLTAGLTYSVSPKVDITAAYSHLTNYSADGATPSGNVYHHGDYVAANVIYNVNKILALGLEYDYGYRVGYDKEGLHTNRIQAQLAVTF